MSCQKCSSERILSLQGKCSDCCFASLGKKEYDGYVPKLRNIGGGDYIDITVCLDCGQLQGRFPINTPEELMINEDDDFDEDK